MVLLVGKPTCLPVITPCGRVPWPVTGGAPKREAPWRDRVAATLPKGRQVSPFPLFCTLLFYGVGGSRPAFLVSKKKERG